MKQKETSLNTQLEYEQNGDDHSGWVFNEVSFCFIKKLR